MRTLFLFFIAASLHADPFGKDADLVNKRSVIAKIRPNGSIHEKLIQFHQDVISPADGPRSHFFPSSSQYTLEAMRKYGFFKGFMLGCDRLQRENDQKWVYRIGCDGKGAPIKLDPVR
jgi:putative component of membrane protein insertase Oxa1/YidC/SpoIIIJ protein YidD